MRKLATAGLETRDPAPWDAHRLWSLWDMLEPYVLFFFFLAQNLSTSQALFRFGQLYSERKPGTKNPYDAIVGTGLTDDIDGVLRVIDHLELLSVADQLKRISKLVAGPPNPTALTREIDDLMKRLADELQRRKFLYVEKDLVQYYDGAAGLFGKVEKKFPKAVGDLNEAGKCLAVGQSTACVFHLSRAMEVAVRRLGKRLNIKITPQITWRVITGAMHDKIKEKPEKTESQNRKKNDWEAASTNLHQVGSVWRNKTMHPAALYTQSQALDVFDATRVFMTELCDL